MQPIHYAALQGRIDIVHCLIIKHQVDPKCAAGKVCMYNMFRTF